MSLELAHFGPVVPATVAACCVAGTPHRRVANSIPAFLMLLSMLDMATGARMLWPATWAALLLIAAVIPAALVRLDARCSADTGDRAMAMHRSLGLVVTAALTLVGSVTLSPGIRSPSAPTTGSGSHSMAAMASMPGMGGLFAGGVSLSTVVTLAALAFAALTALLILRRRSGSGPGHTRRTVETLGMGLSVVMMALES
ncbi:hypothetical protein BH09ACT6_BH09ACT6_03270 [soil metagenome]